MSKTLEARRNPAAWRRSPADDRAPTIRRQWSDTAPDSSFPRGEENRPSAGKKARGDPGRESHHGEFGHESSLLRPRRTSAARLSLGDVRNAPTPRPKLVLIDGYSNIFRAFYAIRNLSNSKGEPTNAVYGFVNMLRKLAARGAAGADRRGLGLSASRPCAATSFAEYKANRAPMPDDLRPQIPLDPPGARGLSHPASSSCASYEADDVIGTLALQGRGGGLRRGPRHGRQGPDAARRPAVSIFHTGPRTSSTTPPAVEEDFGVPPEQVVDVLALMGDAVDNVPGVPGIGEKGAQQLIQEYGSLEDAARARRRDHPQGLPRGAAAAPRAGAAVEGAGRPSTPTCRSPSIPRRCASIRPTPRRCASCSPSWSSSRCSRSCDAERPRRAAAATPIGGRASCRALAGEDWAALRGRGRRSRALDRASPSAGSPVGARGRRAEGGAVVRRLPARRSCAPRSRERSRGWLGDPSVELVGHDLKECCAWCRRRAGSCCALAASTPCSRRTCSSPRARPRAEEIALERLGQQAITRRSEAGFEKGQEPPRRATSAWALRRRARGDSPAPMLPRRCCASCAATGTLQSVYRDDRGAAGRRCWWGWRRPASRSTCRFLARDVGRAGRRAGRARGGDLRARRRARSTSTRRSSSARSCSRSSGCRSLKRTQKTKSYSTDAETLEELAAPGYPLPEKLLRYRELAKLKSTYVDALPPLVGAGRPAAHPLRPGGGGDRPALVGRTRTCRTSRSAPRSGSGSARRSSRRPGTLLLVADYSQIELRILAHIAGEQALIEAFAQRRGHPPLDRGERSSASRPSWSPPTSGAPPRRSTSASSTA